MPIGLDAEDVTATISSYQPTRAGIVTVIRITTRRPGPSATPALQPAPPRSAEPIPDWRTTENQTLQEASRISGVSIAGLYRARAENKLAFRRLQGRVLVSTESLVAFVEGAEPWVPSERGKEARAARRATEHGVAA